MSVERQIEKLVAALSETNILLAKNVQTMEHTQKRAEAAHIRIDKLSDELKSQYSETSKSIVNLAVSQERLSGLIQKNVMTKEKFIGWLVIGVTAVAVLYSAIGKVLN